MKPKRVSGFRYAENYGKFSENEFYNVFVCIHNGKVNPNKLEMEYVEKVSWEKIVKDIDENPQKCIIWLRKGVEECLKASIYK